MYFSISMIYYIYIKTTARHIMLRADLLELQRLLAIVKAEHPEYVLLLTEDKASAQRLLDKTHELYGEFTIELDFQVEMCLDDPTNNNL